MSFAFQRVLNLAGKNFPKRAFPGISAHLQSLGRTGQVAHFGHGPDKHEIKDVLGGCLAFAIPVAVVGLAALIAPGK